MAQAQAGQQTLGQAGLANDAILYASFLDNKNRLLAGSKCTSTPFVDEQDELISFVPSITTSPYQSWTLEGFLILTSSRALNLALNVAS